MISSSAIEGSSKHIIAHRFDRHCLRLPSGNVFVVAYETNQASEPPNTAVPAPINHLLRSELLRQCRQWFNQIKTFLYVLCSYPVMPDIVICHRQNKQCQIEAFISNLFIICKHYSLHNRAWYYYPFLLWLVLQVFSCRIKPYLKESKRGSGKILS